MNYLFEKQSVSDINKEIIRNYKYMIINLVRSNDYKYAGLLIFVRIYLYILDPERRYAFLIS